MEIRILVQHARESQRVQVTVDIDGASPRLRYGNGKQTWRPKTAIVTWERYRDPEVWSEWRPTQLIVKGPWLRADGSDSGRTEHREEWITMGGDTLTEAVVAATRPSDAAHLPPDVDNR
jgi:hypothetical protein